MILGRSGYIGRNLANRLPPVDMVINCIGKKDIPWCETHRAETFDANLIKPATIACTYQHSPMIHIGSDHSYGMDTQHTVYAQSKLLADRAVLQINPDAMVIVTGHVYAADCPWVVWLDGELKAGRQVVAYVNRTCRPTWIGDLAAKCLQYQPGLDIVLGADIVNRYQLFRTYAEVFGYDVSLITEGVETNPLLIGTSCTMAQGGCGLREGFEKMKAGL